MERVKDVLETKFRREIVATYRKVLDGYTKEKMEMDRERVKVKRETHEMEQKMSKGSMPITVISQKALSDLKERAKEMTEQAKELVGKMEEAIIAFDIVRDVIIYPSELIEQKILARNEKLEKEQEAGDARFK